MYPVAGTAEDIIPRMLAATATVASAETRHGRDSSSDQAKQVTLSVAQQRLQQVKRMLMRQQPEAQPQSEAETMSAEQHQQQQLEMDCDMQGPVDAQQTRLGRLSGSLQSLQAGLKARMSQKHQLLSPVQPDNSQQVEASTDIADNSAKHDEQSNSQLEEPLPADAQMTSEAHANQTAASETRFQKLARLTWRRSPSLDAGVVVQPNSRSTADVTQQDARDSSGRCAVEPHSDSNGTNATADGTNNAVAAPEVPDQGIALDAAVQQPASLLRSLSQKLHILYKQTPISPIAIAGSVEPQSGLSQRNNEGAAGALNAQQLLTDLRQVAQPSDDGNAEQLPDVHKSAQQPTSQGNCQQPAGLRLATQTHACGNTQQTKTQSAEPTLLQPTVQRPAVWQRLGSQLGQQVNNAVSGASNTVRAMAALLPSYPNYVHIGSHQILLPASPALTQAVQSAQQQGPAAQQRQALMMHSMAAYRGRALAICRLASVVCKLVKSWLCCLPCSIEELVAADLHFKCNC